MVNKKDGNEEENDLSGFQEFIESQKGDMPFLPRGVGGGKRKQEQNFNNLTFLTNDRSRLTKLRLLLNEKINFIAKFKQSEELLKLQDLEINELREKIYDVSDVEESPYRKSLREIFDGFFKKNS